MEMCSRNHAERECGVGVGGEGKGTLEGWWCARGRETHTHTHTTGDEKGNSMESFSSQGSQQETFTSTS